MDDARQIRQRFEAVMERMGQTVRLRDHRLEPAETLHRGYRTRGTATTWEFRFLEVPAGLQKGSLLSLDSDGERWRVEKVHFERDGNELLFVSAQVASLDAVEGPPSDEQAALLQKLSDLLQRSSLGPLERDDVGEALQRLPRLFSGAPGPEPSARIKARLKLLAERFKACPQTAHEAKGTILKLEAHLKRKGAL
jgi:hypothetical protein